MRVVGVTRFTAFQGKMCEIATRLEHRVWKALTHKFITEDSMFNLSDILLAQLSWNKSGEAIDWLSEIRKGLPKVASDLRATLLRAIEVGAVRYVFDQVPETMPDFLQQSETRA
jgi:hypothetical protein